MTDDLTGLVYLRARYYHPASGTFLTQDPVLGVAGGPASTFNPYLYVRGNPVNWTDPSGEFLPLLLFGAAALVTGLVSGFSDVLSHCTFDLGRSVKAALGGLAAFAAAVLASVGVGVLFTAIAGALAVTGIAAALLGATSVFLSGIAAGQTFRFVGNKWRGQDVLPMFEVGDMIRDGLTLGPVFRLLTMPGLEVRGSEIRFGNDLRVAPMGNRTGNQLGELPHYHRRIIDPKTGQTLPGQGIGRHRPWEVRPSDKMFWDRF